MSSLEENKKKRGAFFTPLPIAQFLADWAIRSPTDIVLEPSCGEAVFLEAAGRRIGIISQANQREPARLQGVEIHRASALTAERRLASLGYQAEITCNDFFSVATAPDFDVVLGNPPFVRYQSFSGDSRLKALEAALAQGVPLKRLSSAWAAFLVHAASFLKPNGRLGFVLPAELLATHYAAEVRSFLLRRFGSLKIILFERLVFPEVMEEVILLLAEGHGGCNSFEVVQIKDLDCLNRAILRGNGYAPPTPRFKWTTALLHREAQDILGSLAQSKDFELLRNWGQISLGFVTGSNAFFALTEEARLSHGLTEKDVIRICPPGGRKLTGLSLKDSTWRALRDRGERAYLFYPHTTKLGPAANRYVEKGKRAKVHLGYKCSNRDPWWRVPVTEKPDLIFTYMSHHMPRLITNEAGVLVSNSMYGVSLVRNRKAIGRDLLPRLLLNSVSALSAELEGRSYGGGLLKHEPREADGILVPSLHLSARLADDLNGARQLPSTCLDLDEMLFRSGAIASREALSIIQRARSELLHRRTARNRSSVAQRSK